MQLRNDLPSWIIEGAKKNRRPLESNDIKMFNAPELRWVWDSIEKKKYPLEKNSFFASTKFAMVFSAIQNGHHPLDSWESMPKSERKSKAKRISDSAEKLKAEISFIEDGSIFPTRGTPGMTWGMFSYYTADMTYEYIQASGMLDIDDTSEQGAFLRALSEDDKGSVEQIIRGAYWFAIKRAPDLIDSFVQASQNFAEKTPEIYRPNDKNAQRLLFIRRLTRMFVRHFGKPMREETLSITGYFYDISDIDAAALSRLAPVPKERKRKLHTGE